MSFKDEYIKRVGIQMVVTEPNTETCTVSKNKE